MARAGTLRTTPAENHRLHVLHLQIFLLFANEGRKDKVVLGLTGA